MQRVLTESDAGGSPSGKSGNLMERPHKKVRGEIRQDPEENKGKYPVTKRIISRPHASRIHNRGWWTRRVILLPEGRWGQGYRLRLKRSRDTENREDFRRRVFLSEKDRGGDLKK